MATTSFSLSSTIDHYHYNYHNHRHKPILPNTKTIFPNTPKPSPRFNLQILSCTSNPSSQTTSLTQETQNPLPNGRFLTDPDLKNLQILQNFKLFHKLPSGSMLLIRVMQEQELDMTVDLLAESFAESMLLPKAYVKLLAYLVKQYLVERRGLMPHAATLIAFHRSESESEGEDIQLAGTVEVSFNNKGANVAPPTPVPPKNAPYICNMTVKKSLRRQGIGWQLLKASEELISQMSSVREVYLHCRMIDIAPFNMYSRAGYSVYKTDSILILLTLQRRKHLMCKQLPTSTNIVSETNTVYNDEKNLAPMDV